MKNLLTSPTSNFNATRDGRNAPDFYFDLDLSTPFNQFVNIAGNSFYVDANPSDGNCVAYFQETDALRGPTPFYISPGFIARIPFTQIRFVNATAQAGKKIRIVYGTDTDFQPGSVSQVSVGGNIANRPESPTGFSSVLSALSAASSETVFTPAANVNGCILLSAMCEDMNAVGQTILSLIAHTSAPGAVTTGECLMRAVGVQSGGASYISGAELYSPQYIAAGKGLYWRCAADTGGTCSRVTRYKML